MEQQIVHIQGPGDVENLSDLIRGILSGEIEAADCPASVSVTDWQADGTGRTVEIPVDYTDIEQRGWDELGPMLEEMAAGDTETAANNFKAGVTFVVYQGGSHV